MPFPRLLCRSTGTDLRCVLAPLHRQTCGVKTAINAVRPGAVITHKDRPHLVVKTHHSVMGRGSAHVKLDLKDVVSGSRLTERFKSGGSVDTVQLMVRTLKYLYHDSATIHVMDAESFEQFAVPLDVLQGGDKAVAMLEDDTLITLSLYNDVPIAARLPANFVMTIVETNSPNRTGVNATVKGMGYKTATMGNGVKVEVPEFCKEGDKIELLFEEGATRYLRRIM